MASKDPAEFNHVPAKFLFSFSFHLSSLVCVIFQSSPVQSSRVVRLLTYQSPVFSCSPILLFFLLSSFSVISPPSFPRFSVFFPSCFDCESTSFLTVLSYQSSVFVLSAVVAVFSLLSAVLCLLQGCKSVLELQYLCDECNLVL